MNAIPGTIVDQAAKSLRWHRIEDAPIGRRYRADSAEGILIAVLGHEPVEHNGIIQNLWHISVSFRTHAGEQNRCPNWDELKSAKYALVPEDVPMVLIFPKKTAPYVNLHTTTLHLWEAESGIDE